MKPIYFSSYGGYRRFCASWWNELLRYTTGITFGGWLHYREIKAKPVRWGIPGWCYDIYTFYHRGRYGWAPRDVWSLDHYLNRVLGHSLQHLGKTTSGAPTGYPLGAKAPTDKFGVPATDHAQWEADLQRWGQAFLDLHAWVEGADLQTEDIKARIKEEHRLYQQVRKTLREMAPWWAGLWD